MDTQTESESVPGEDAPTKPTDSTEAGDVGTAAPPNVPKLGEILGRYELVSEVGRGGMGVVYEARDPKLDRRVALKVVLHQRDEETLARMTREAQAVARLSHPNVVQIFDIGLRSARPYLVMEFVDGVTLGEWKPSGRKPRWRQVLKAYMEAGRGLAAAHAVGIVHRDFKPANAIVDRRGHVKVLDFGLARAAGDLGRTSTANAIVSGVDSTLTATGIAMGTPRFMAPEQHRGERADERADIYGFGIALYEALYTARAFEGSSTDMLYLAKRVGLAPEPPDEDVPDEIYTALRKAVAFAPTDRWSSMEELLAALRRPIRRQRRSALLWILPGAAALGVTATLFPSEPAAPVPPTQLATPSVDVELVLGAQALIDEAKQRRADLEAPRGLGSAFAALSVAAASGSAPTVARAQLQLGGSLMDVGHYGMAVPELRAGIDLAQAAGEDAAAAEGATRLIYALGRLGRADEALEAGRLARALAERIEDDGHLVLKIMGNEATALPPNRFAERIRLNEEALAIRLSTPGLANPVAVATLQTNLGATLKYTEPDRARELLTKSLATREEHLRPNHPDTLGTMLMLIAVETGAGAPGHCAEGAEEIYDRMPAQAPAMRASAAAMIASCLQARREPDRALFWVGRALDVPEQQRDTIPYARALELQASFLGDKGEFTKAEAASLRGIFIREAHAHGPDSGVGMAYYNLATILVQGEGDSARIEAYFLRALDELNRSKESLGVELMFTYVGLGGFLVREERFAEAAELLRGPVELAEVLGAVDDQHFKEAEANGVYARALWETEPDHTRARAFAAESLKFYLEQDKREVRPHDDLRTWVESVTAGD